MIVTPNIEQIETEGGLDDLLASILVQAGHSNCPVVFALSRKKLGQVRNPCRPSPLRIHPTRKELRQGIVFLSDTSSQVSRI